MTANVFAPRSRERGQALVEFTLAIMVFIVMMVALFDVGRGIYMYNGVSEAAREIARRASVHTCANALTCLNGQHPEVLETIAIQQNLIPNMTPMSPGSPDFECIDIAGNPVAGECVRLDFIQVTVQATYSPILAGIIGPINLKSVSSVQIP